MDRKEFFLEQQAVTTQQSLDLAVQHHTAGNLTKAKAIYEQILKADPNQPDALHLLGMIFSQMGENDRAVDLLTRALNSKASFTEAHNNLGNVFKKLKQVEKAIACYRRAINIKPDYFEAYYNLANVLKEVGNFDESIANYHKALSINPDFSEAHSNLGLTLQETGRLDEAIVHYQEAIYLNPDYVEAHYDLGKVLAIKGEKQKAIFCFKKVCRLDQGDARTAAELALAHLGAMDAPTKTPKEYMKGIYKTHLRNWTSMTIWNHDNNKYQGHKLISDILYLGLKDHQNLRILDAGCGTGILGSFLRPYANYLEGVDLSPDMIQIAINNEFYDNLVEDDLDNHLSKSDKIYDLIVCAAVLIHFAELRSILSKIKNALDKDGLLALTLFVDNECETFSVDSSGYFSHNPIYIRNISSVSGLNLIQEKHGVHELRGTEKVRGAAYLFQKNLR